MNALLSVLLAASIAVVVAAAAAIGVSRRLERGAAPRTLARLGAAPLDCRIVVLGCPSHTASGEPNRYLLGRVAAAAAAYHHSPGRRLLCSGGSHRSDPGRDEAEAEAIAQLLVAANVPRAAIDLDPHAARTLDSVEHLAASDDDTAILLVTQPFHLPRALYLARASGLDAWGLPADGPSPALAMRLRERLAQLRALFERYVARRRA